MKKLLPAALIITLLSGCFGVVASDRFTYRGPAEIPEGVLRLDGYYYSAETVGEGDPESQFMTGTSMSPLVLWTDGTAAFAWASIARVLSWGEGPEPDRFGTLADAQERFESEIGERLSGERSDEFHWGAFRLRGDSISVQVLHWGMSGRPGQYFPVEYNGAVLNDTTIVLTEVIDSVSHTLGRAGSQPPQRHPPVQGVGTAAKCDELDTDPPKAVAHEPAVEPALAGRPAVPAFPARPSGTAIIASLGRRAVTPGG